MSRIGKPVEMENQLVVLVVPAAGVWAVGPGLGVTANMHQISLQENDNVPKLNCDNGDTPLWVNWKQAIRLYNLSRRIE